MRTRLRAPGGASTVNLPDDATVGDLIAQITEKTSLPSFDVKYGYPPKPLLLEESENSLALSKLDVKLDGEQLTISAKADATPPTTEPMKQQSGTTSKSSQNEAPTPDSFSFSDIPGAPTKNLPSGPVSLQRKSMEGDVPTEPFLERNATVGKSFPIHVPNPRLRCPTVLRVMPDDNSCLFRAFSYAVLPTDDKVVVELRSIIAQAIRSNPELYTKVVLEQEPENYCAWIQTQDAWGGAIELGILAQHFEVEICSIDVQVHFLIIPYRSFFWAKFDSIPVRQSRQVQRRRPNTLHPRLLWHPLRHHRQLTVRLPSHHCLQPPRIRHPDLGFRRRRDPRESQGLVQETEREALLHRYGRHGYQVQDLRDRGVRRSASWHARPADGPLRYGGGYDFMSCALGWPWLPGWCWLRSTYILLGKILVDSYHFFHT